MLAADSSPLVRDGFLQMLADCCTNMPERYDYEGRISPYVKHHCEASQLAAERSRHAFAHARRQVSAEWAARSCPGVS
jgi:hypothetical protein